MSVYTALREIGLTASAAACYETLYEGVPDTAGNLAKNLSMSRSTVYLAINWLEQWGFIERLPKILPEVTHFKAIRLDKALENLAVRQRQIVRDIVESQIERTIRQLTH